jgi:Ca-activated chloride channel homolog
MNLQFAVLPALLFAFLPDVVLGQNPAVIQTETRLVSVDTIVTGKKDQPVRDLSTKDFRIWEDNKEQTIQSVSLNASRPSRTILFFDEASLAMADQLRSRPDVSGFIDANAGPDHLMAIVNFDHDVRVLQTFTDNPGRLKEALNKAQPSNAAASADRSDPATVLANVSSRSVLLGLDSFARSLENLPGRKTLILFSGGVPTMQKEQLGTVIDACNRAKVSVYSFYSFDLSDPTLSGGTDLSDGAIGLPSLGQPGSGRSRMPREASSPYDPQTLISLARGTGGFAVSNTTPIRDGLRKIAQEQDEYYVIAYTPPDSKIGACHALRVKVARSGVTVRMRSGYCTEKPLDVVTENRVTENRAGKDLEQRATESQSGNIRTSIRLPFFYTAANVARVHLVLQLASAGVAPEMNIVAQAVTSDGTVAARVDDKVRFDSPRYEKTFDIAAGRYTFTVVFSSAGKDIGKLELPLDIDPYNPAEFTVSGLALSRETAPASELDLGGNSVLLGNRTSLVAASTRYVPSGADQFAKGDPGFVYFEVYEPRPAPVAVDVRILDANTRAAKKDSGPIRIEAPQDGAVVRIGEPLPLDGLDSGSYLLEVSVEEAGGKRATRLTPIEIR